MRKSQEHDFLLISLWTDYTVDPLRDDSRHTELVSKIGLPQ
ncbi:MAG: hypothetical protein WB616_01875 [Candidatus Sulfotelmatobacter sp.]